MHVARTRWYLMVLVGVCLIAGMTWWFRTARSSRTIHNASAADSPQRLASVVNGPQRLKNMRWRELIVKDDPYLKIGPGKLEWSSHSPGSAYLYFRTFSSVPDWEFAPCERHELGDITEQDVRRDFIGAGDPKGHMAFGADWKTNAIVFATGQIILVRFLKAPAVVYAVRISEQDGQTLRVNYVEFERANELK